MFDVFAGYELPGQTMRNFQQPDSAYLVSRHWQIEQFYPVHDVPVHARKTEVPVNVCKL